jgi:hypothetical protein
VLETDDGTRAFHRIATTGGATCSPVTATDDLVRCLPEGVSVSGVHADIDCMSPLGTVSASAECAPPSHAREGSSACGGQVAVREVTGMHEGTTFRESLTTDECIDDFAMGNYVTLGDVEDPAAFPATPLETGPGDRLVERRYAIGDDYGDRATLYDTELDAECAFLPDRNGDLRCIPLSPGVIVNPAFYRDSGCSVSLVTIGGNRCPGAYAVERIARDCEPTRYDVVRVGARFSGTLYHESGSFCTRPTAPGEFGLAFFQKGDPVAPEEMVLGTVERR